jgi:transposase
VRQELSKNVEYLMSVSGVGWIVSTYFLSAIGGPKNLNNTRSSCHFFGLAPREHSTGEKIRRGRITAIGDPLGRKMMIQAAWIAIRKDEGLGDCFWNVFYKNPRHIAAQKAIIAVARKLVCRMHAVLREQRIYKVKTGIEKTA